jgi:hypothetical protein
MQTISSGTHEPPGHSFASRARKGTIAPATNAPLQLSAGISKHMVDVVNWKSNFIILYYYYYYFVHGICKIPLFKIEQIGV